MAEQTSMVSLAPEAMRRFAARASVLDETLQREAAQLAGLLERFDQVCVEPGFRQPALAPLAGEMRRLARDAAELNHWVSAVAVRADEADTVAPQTMGSVPAPHAVPTPIVGDARSVLLQSAPDGDPAVLATLRYESADQFEISRLSGRAIHTVADHIREYGCLLTSYTMVLRDAGAHVSVADLYKANYALMTGRTFDADASQGAVTLPDLNTTGAVAARATNDQFVSAAGALGAEPARDLRDAVERFGALIVRTERAGSEHWIVVDSANADGTFNVRDPMWGAQTHVQLENRPGAQYLLAPATHYLYVRSKV